jgi:hypothetical protein
MTGGADPSAGCGEGQRRRGWRRFLVRKAATGWGATDAQAGWAGREAEAQWGRKTAGWEGNMKWTVAGPKPELGPFQVIKPFQIFIWNFKFLATLEICTRRFRRNFGMGIFPKFL